MLRVKICIKFGHHQANPGKQCIRMQQNNSPDSIKPYVNEQNPGKHFDDANTKCTTISINIFNMSCTQCMFTQWYATSIHCIKQ